MTRFWQRWQIAIQKKKVMPQDPLYLVDKALWDAMDNANKAALMLHEVIYTDAIAFKHSNSIRTRYFNGLVHSDRLPKMTSAEWHKFVSGPSALGEMIELDHKGFVAIRGFTYKHNSWDYVQDRIRLTCTLYGMAPVVVSEARSQLRAFYKKIKEKTGEPLVEKDYGLIFALLKSSSPSAEHSQFFVNMKLFEDETGEPTNRVTHSVCKPK